MHTKYGNHGSRCAVIQSGARVIMYDVRRTMRLITQYRGAGQVVHNTAPPNAVPVFRNIGVPGVLVKKPNLHISGEFAQNLDLTQRSGKLKSTQEA